VCGAHPQAVSEIGLPAFREGERAEVVSLELGEGRTAPPSFLTESDLIAMVCRPASLLGLLWRCVCPLL
jgi:DNA topoisomerase IA